jgi:glycosyltransferase involved in cell wall biosynthesis
MQDQFEPIKREEVLVHIVVPVYNEQAILETSIRHLAQYLDSELPFKYRITIAENGCTDNTPSIAEELSCEMQQVDVTLLTQKGRGRALKKVWGESNANVLAYMDVDLSTGLEAFVDLIRPLIEGAAPIGIGSRLRKGARTERSLQREIISRIYNLLLRWTLKIKASDAQCGFKAIRADAARVILPEISDTGWFFDTEMLAKAEHRGWAIHEVPVSWKEDKDSRVRIARTALDDLKGIRRVRREFAHKSIS